mgnify:CR=1 FL=1
MSVPTETIAGADGGAVSTMNAAGALIGLVLPAASVPVVVKLWAPSANGGVVKVQLPLGSTTAVPMIKAGKVKPLGTSGLKRSSQLPDVPTIAEAGVPGYEVDVWYGLFVPQATPKPTTTSSTPAYQKLGPHEVSVTTLDLGSAGNVLGERLATVYSWPIIHLDRKK